MTNNLYFHNKVLPQVAEEVAVFVEGPFEIMEATTLMFQLDLTEVLGTKRIHLSANNL